MGKFLDAYYQWRDSALPKMCSVCPAVIPLTTSGCILSEHLLDLLLDVFEHLWVFNRWADLQGEKKTPCKAAPLYNCDDDKQCRESSRESTVRAWVPPAQQRQNTWKQQQRSDIFFDQSIQKSSFWNFTTPHSLLETTESATTRRWNPKRVSL